MPTDVFSYHFGVMAHLLLHCAWRGLRNGEVFGKAHDSLDLAQSQCGNEFRKRAGG
jgi:hypothetical protein